MKKSLLKIEKLFLTFLPISLFFSLLIIAVLYSSFATLILTIGVMLLRLVKIPKLFLRLLSISILLFLLLLSATSYGGYQLLVLNIGVMLICCLIILMQISRSKLWKISVGLLVGVVIFCTSFLAIPDINFWITFNTRQDMVNKYLEDNLTTQTENSFLGETYYYRNPDGVKKVLFTVKTENSFLGETNYYKRADGVKVFFTVYKSPFHRVFFIYSNRGPVNEHKMHVRELTKNWYFGSGGYAD